MTMIKENKDYYFASIPEMDSEELFKAISSEVETANLNEIQLVPSEKYHVTDFYFPSFEKIKNILGQDGQNIDFNEFQKMLENFPIQQFNERKYIVSDIKAMGEDAISLILGSDNEGGRIHQEARNKFVSFLRNQKISEEAIDQLFSNKDITLHYYKNDGFVPHLTVAKTNGEKEKEKIIDLLKSKFIGYNISFNNLRLQEN